MRTLFKRWWFWVATVLIMAGIAATALLIYPSQSKITRANFDRIQTGMTSEEVEQILGPSTGTSAEGGIMVWCEGESVIIVNYDLSNSRVIHQRFDPGTCETAYRSPRPWQWLPPVFQ